MKILLTEAENLLKAAGVADAEIVTENPDPDFKMDAVLGVIDTARTPIIRPKLESEIKEAVQNTTVGKIAGTFKSAIFRAFSAAGVTRKELDEYGAGKEEEMVNAVLTKYNAFAGKDTEALRTQLTDMSTKHADEIKVLKDAQKAAIEAEQQKFIGRDIEEGLAGITTKIPRIGGDPNAQAKMLKANLESLYHVHFNPDTRKIELRDKANHEKVVLNEAGTQVLQVEDVAKVFYTNLGIVATDSRGTNPAGAMQGQPGASGTPQYQPGAAAGTPATYNGQQGGYGQNTAGQPFNPSLDPLAAENAKLMAELGMNQAQTNGVH